MSRTSAPARHGEARTRAAASPAKLDRLAVVALCLEVVPMVTLVAAFLGAYTANSTIATLADVTLLGLPAGFVCGIVALVRLRGAQPRRRGTAIAVTATIVPPALFVALIVLVAVALSNLELS